MLFNDLRFTQCFLMILDLLNAFNDFSQVYCMLLMILVLLAYCLIIASL